MNYQNVTDLPNNNTIFLVWAFKKNITKKREDSYLFMKKYYRFCENVPPFWVKRTSVLSKKHLLLD